VLHPSTAAVAGRRARPLPPDARRAALIVAALPLIRKHGLEVSTRQIAQAAGVAEGTIFRVFPDKDSLVQAAIEAAFDPGAVLGTLQFVDPTRPLEERLLEIVRIIEAWLGTVIELMMALRGHWPPGKKPPRRVPRPSDVICDTVARLIEPDRAELRVAPVKVARLLNLLLFSTMHPGIAGGNPLTPEEIVEFVLDGVRVRGNSRTAKGTPK